MTLVKYDRLQQFLNYIAALLKLGITRNDRFLLLCLFLICDLCTVCLGLFALLLGVIGRQCSVIGALPGHRLN